MLQSVIVSALNEIGISVLSSYANLPAVGGRDDRNCQRTHREHSESRNQSVKSRGHPNEIYNSTRVQS